MNHREFVALLAEKNGMSVQEADSNVDLLISVIHNVLAAGDSISISGFGILEVKIKKERVSVNPGNGQRMLIPPKRVVNYKPSALLKSKLN